METCETDVVVVGAGLAGLTAAALATRAGARTVVLDAHEAGGRARTDDHHGYQLNLGAHALYEHGAARRILASLGIDPPGAAPLTRGSAVWRHGRAHALPAGPLSMLATGALSAAGKAQLVRLAVTMARLDPPTVADRSLAEWLDDQRLPGDLRTLAEMAARTATYCDAPELISADAAVLQIRAALRGVRYLHGGWQRLVERLSSAVTAGPLGTVVAGTRVRAVAPAGAGRWLVDAGDLEVTAGAVVLAAGGPATAAALLPEPPGWELGPDVEASCLDLGLPGDHPSRPAVLLSADDPHYLSSHTPPADLAPAGRRLVSLLRYLRPGDRTPAGTLRSELWAHAARAGIAPDDAVMQRYLHRMTVAHNLPGAGRGGLPGRPAAAVAGYDGLAVAGDWVGPEGLLADASVASAAAAARLATRASRKVAA